MLALNLPREFVTCALFCIPAPRHGQCMRHAARRVSFRWPPPCFVFVFVFVSFRFVRRLSRRQGRRGRRKKRGMRITNVELEIAGMPAESGGQRSRGWQLISRIIRNSAETELRERQDNGGLPLPPSPFLPLGRSNV